MNDDRLRVFVNEKPVSVARGARVRDAVAAFDARLGDLVAASTAYVTDGVGRTVDGTDPVGEAGAVFRVIVPAGPARARLSKDELRRWPKVELHVHLDGSLRPATMLELAREQGVRLPADTPAELALAVSGRKATSLEDYLTKYAITLSVMQTAAAIERIADELVHDVAAEHVRYAEVRFSPLLHRPALTLSGAIEAALGGIARGTSETGTRVGLIVCGIRNLPPAQSVELVRAAADYRSAGVVGFDLAGAERAHPAGEHREAFALAAEVGLGRTCHAGEGDGPSSIREALHVCGAQRIGHGTRLVEDPALLEEVVANRIPLEVCLTSNVHTRAVPAVSNHPLRRYFDAGVPLTLNTDGRLVDGVTLTDELYLAQATFGFDKEQLAGLVTQACDYVFLPEYERVALAARLQSEMADATA